MYHVVIIKQNMFHVHVRTCTCTVHVYVLYMYMYVHVYVLYTNKEYFSQIHRIHTHVQLVYSYYGYRCLVAPQLTNK